jgi:hypothetical protein
VCSARVVVFPVAEFRLAVCFEKLRGPCSIRSRAEGTGRHCVATAQILLVHWNVKDRPGEGQGCARDRFEV